MKTPFLFLIIIILISCSSNTDLNKIKKITNIYFSKNKNVERNLTRELISDIKYPLVLVNTNGLIKQILMLPISTRYTFQNYISGSGQGLTFNGASIIRTNGFNTSLISMSIDEISVFTQKTPL